MEKLTDNEIIKALECCIVHENCEGCPCAEYNSQYCLKATCKNALDLINRQKEEIDILIRKKETLRDEIAEQQTEIERLQKENPMDAIKEFAKRLKRTYTNHIVCSYSVLNNEIDKLVKELEEQTL